MNVWCMKYFIRHAQEELISPGKQKAVICCNSMLYMEGILPKRPYLPCVSMAGRALLAVYHRYVLLVAFDVQKWKGEFKFLLVWFTILCSTNQPQQEKQTPNILEITTEMFIGHCLRRQNIIMPETMTNAFLSTVQSIDFCVSRLSHPPALPATYSGVMWIFTSQIPGNLTACSTACPFKPIKAKSTKVHCNQWIYLTKGQ